MRWFRFYDDVVNDPKVQRLPDALFRTWVNLMCLASKGGGLIGGELADIAFSLRLTEAKTASQIEALRTAGLLDKGEPLRIHNWASRQYDSDSSAERMRRHRERHRDVTVTASDAKSDAVESEADTEAERIDLKKVVDKIPRARARGSNRSPEWIKSRWEQKVCTAVAQQLPPEAIAAIESYQRGEAEGARIFNDIDRAMKAGKP